MALIFNKEGLRDLTPPCVVQHFVNHDAILFKVCNFRWMFSDFFYLAGCDVLALLVQFSNTDYHDAFLINRSL